MPGLELLPHAYFEKKIVPLDEAKVSIATHSLQYGTTCFTGIRGYHRDSKIRLFRLKDHWQRLVNTVKILEMPLTLEWDTFHTAIVELVRSNKPARDIYIRPLIFAHDCVLVPRFDGLHFDLAIYMFLMGDYHATTRGLDLIISSWQKFSNLSMPSKAKSGGSYVNSALAATEAHKLHKDDALLLNSRGEVVEASSANIVVVYRGEIYLPDLGAEQLEGITRRTVIDFLREENLPIHSGGLDRSLIYNADELLLLGTAAQVVYTRSVDDRIIQSENKPGPICQLLRDKYRQVMEGKHPRSKDWLYDVELTP
ncbi:MAG: branched-chain amino acid transaminase [Parachlamydiaceae bacterium]